MVSTEMGGTDISSNAMEGHSPICLDVHAGIVRPLKTSEVVARRILQTILDECLGTGASLPPEAVMMEQYEVSRESLREALRLLEVQGFVTIRRGPGGGPVVGTVDPAAFGRMATMFFQMAGATYDELYDAWSAAEVLLAELAARNPDASVRARLMDPFLEGGPLHEESPVGEQSNFHAALAALAGNRVLEVTMQLFGQIVTHHAVVVGDHDVGRAVVFHDHAEVARAVRAGYPIQAREAMEKHVATVVEHLRGHADLAGERTVAWI